MIAAACGSQTTWPEVVAVVLFVGMLFAFIAVCIWLVLRWL